MLQLKDIQKQYRTGELVQRALDGVSLTLRDNEFVSILGPSGSGKTTLLNIIGGLDRYDSGDLIINGVSTRRYKDRDWDSYRNHTIGFVFQSYNLIPHQSVLSNVELALTIGGVSRGERKKRARLALEQVGLGDQLHKRPNQMSGGQMQRVAIARALVNDPDILLADEPTGALDTETSVQVMELLKAVAKDRLVVMVTHNPELAERYSTRIVRLRDGKIVDDSDPYQPGEEERPGPAPAAELGRVFTIPGRAPVRLVEYRDGKAVETTESERNAFLEKQSPSARYNQTKPPELKKTPEHKKPGRKKKAKMSFGTSLSLSFNNLRTKKGRTILTAFAGSIGIIGIALILALSNGVNTYITDIQRETMTSYPITISAETLDLSGMMETHNTMMGGVIEEPDPDRAGMYADCRAIEASEAITDSVKENNLSAFKEYLDDPESEIHGYLGENGISYSYRVSFSAYSYDKDGELIDSDAEVDDIGSSGAMAGQMENMRQMSAMMMGGSASKGAANFSQLMEGEGGETVSPILLDSYDVLYGSWPEKYDEAVLVLEYDNSLPAETLYQLGFLTGEEYEDIEKQVEKNGGADELNWDYEDVCNHSFYVVPAAGHYTENGDGTFSPQSFEGPQGELPEDAVELKLTGVIRPKKDANNDSISTAVAYTGKLTDWVIAYTDQSPVVKAQEKDGTTNVLTGMRFEVPTEDEKVEDAKEYLSNLGVSDKASFYSMVMYYAAQEQAEGTTAEPTPVPTALPTTMPTALPEGMAGDPASMPEGMSNGAAAMPMDEAGRAAALDQWLENDPDRDLLLSVYAEYIEGASYEDNMKEFGKVSYSAPDSISLYTDSFEDKESVSACIDRYNEGVKEENRIVYTDYVALLTSSITQIVNVISYVLIAFVAVSLVVSCIMIGIITHISVLERTKEIGILRALGASKRNISQVFNAETIIIGLIAGALGVGVSSLLTIPINSLIRSLLDVGTLNASIPLGAAVILVVISVVITVIGGLIPAKNAAKKDPVTALRTE